MQNKNNLMLVLSMLIISTLACSLPFTSQPAVIENNDESGTIFDGRSGVSFQDDLRVEITVPGSYIIGSSGSDLAPLLGELQSESGQDAAMLQRLFQNHQADILFWGYEPGGQGIPSVSFVVLKNDEYFFMPLGLIGSVAGLVLGEDVNIVQQDRLTLGNRDTLRLIMTSDITGPQAYQVAYLFKEAGKLFIVGFIAEKTTVENQIGLFNSIVSSIIIVSD